MAPPQKKVKSKFGAIQKRVGPEIDLLREQIAAVAAGSGKVLVGPFTSEVGFELLYWIPFLRWAVREFPQLRGRLLVVSRGGVASWYAGLDADYLDLFDLSSVDELVARRVSLKQPELTLYEREVVERARVRTSSAALELLHPSILFSFYARAIKADSLAFARAIAVQDDDALEGLAALFEPISTGAIPQNELELPEDYLAVRFYFRPSFPDTPENRRFAAGVVESIARQSTVVLLNNDLEIDDHRDLDHPAGGRVVRVGHLAGPGENLRLQTEVIAGARAFVGTYGGLAYLAPLLGVPSIAFTSHAEHVHSWHLDLAQRVFDHPGYGRLVMLRPDDLDLIGLIRTPVLQGAFA